MRGSDKPDRKANVDRVKRNFCFIFSRVFWLFRSEDVADKLMAQMMQTVGAGAFFGLTAQTLYPLIEGLAGGRFTVAQLWATPKSAILVGAALLGLAALFWCIWKLRVVLKLA